jgi:hypothetical protein
MNTYQSPKYWLDFQINFVNFCMNQIFAHHPSGIEIGEPRKIYNPYNMKTSTLLMDIECIACD